MTSDHAIGYRANMLAVIVAIADNGVIGRDNDLPWRLSADLKRFRAITTGHTLVMGRRTWESIGRPLPDRRSIVVTRQRDYHAAGAQIARSLPQAIDLAGDDDCFVIGGASLFAEALNIAQRLYLTRVHANVQGDVRLDPIDLSHWRLVERAEHAADERNEFATTFEQWERVRE